MRTQFAQVRHRWQQIPVRTKMGMLVAVLAISGLAWQHYSDSDTDTAAPDPQQSQQAPPGQIPADHDGHALGEYQPAPSELPPAQDFSVEAARLTAERFTTNLASPNGNRDDWLARISPDAMPELLDQYRLTDIRNVPQASVAQISGPLTADPAIPTFEVTYTDGSRVETTVEMTIDGWKVSSVVPLDTPADPAGPPPPVAPADPAPTATLAPEQAPPNGPAGDTGAAVPARPDTTAIAITNP